jgi:hypothetical protein
VAASSYQTEGTVAPTSDAVAASAPTSAGAQRSSALRRPISGRRAMVLVTGPSSGRAESDGTDATTGGYRLKARRAMRGGPSVVAML